MINSLRNTKEFGLNPESRLWKPLKLGTKTLQHRVGMCPLTRFRSPNGIPNNPMVSEYYHQRASTGGLLITEATFIAEEAGGYMNAPGIYSETQVKEWSKVVDAVHAKGGLIYCQLWALGRVNPGKDPKAPVVYGASPVAAPGDGMQIPIEMTQSDIKRFLSHYKHAAECAVKAGFDGVELHGAHGYLLDQFLQKGSNLRTDSYGGDVENRSRFLMEALDIVSKTIGQERTAVRISPFSPFQGMGESDNPFETWGYVCKEIKRRFPKLAYISVTDPRLGSDSGQGDDKNCKYSADRFRAVFRGVDPESVDKLKGSDFVFPEPNAENPTVFFSGGGYTASDAEESCERTGDVVGYGRLFIANPDLPHRIQNGLMLNAYDRSTFYTATEKGYLDYPFATAETPRYKPRL